MTASRRGLLRVTSMVVIDALGGPAPKIELEYSSASVDGRAVSTNNQASWIGEGFEWHPGIVERRYTTCLARLVPSARGP